MDSFIEVEAVTKRYGKITAVNNVGLRITAGAGLFACRRKRRGQIYAHSHDGRHHIA